MTARPQSEATHAERALPDLVRVAGDLGATAYAVGGYVRDRLIGAATGDVDVLVTRRLRDIALRLAARWQVTMVELRDGKPGVRLVFRDGSHIDLSLPRAAGVGAQHVGAVPLQPGPPAVWARVLQKSRLIRAVWRPRARRVRADLGLRDFTVNAMAVPLERATAGEWREAIIDPTCGLADLDRRVLRATGPGIWQDDPARLMRALRLSAQLGLRIEPGTETAIRRHAQSIAGVAAERVRDELFPLLARPAAEDWMGRAADLGLLFEIIPELAPLTCLGQGGYHHLDAWRHSLAVAAQTETLARDLPGMSPAHRQQVAALMSSTVGGGRPRCALIKLAGLLHDVGKPQTVQTDAEGHVRFYGHDIAGASMARAIGRRLRLARREVQYLEIVVGAHMHPPFLAQQQEVSRHAAHRFFRRTGDCAPDVLLLAWADRLSARGPAAMPEHIQRVERLVRSLLAEWLDCGELSHPRPPVGARAIMRRYGLQPGPKVGVLLRRLTRRQAERPFADADHAWAYLDRLAAHLGARPTDSTEDDANS